LAECTVVYLEGCGGGGGGGGGGGACGSCTIFRASTHKLGI